MSRALTALVLGLLLTLGGCGGSSATPAGPIAARCTPVAPALVDAIETGLTVSGGGSLGRASAVRSDDFEKIWFVAAEITGEGIDEVGVWATNSLTAGDGLIFAADGFARQFADWGAGPGFSIADDGAQEAKDCVA